MKPLQTTLLGIALLIGGLTLCSFGLWLLFSPPQYQAMVRIEIVPDAVSDVSATTANAGISFNPYFIQTTFEIIRSDLVLGNVATNLSLNKIWGEKYASGNPLKTSQTVRRLQQHLHIEGVRNTKLIDIRYTSDDPVEAAKIANGIGQAYKDYRINAWRELMRAGIESYEQQYGEEEKQIQTMRTNVESLRKKFGIIDPVPDAPMLTPDQIRTLNQQKAASELEYKQLADLLNKLKTYSTEQLRDVLPTVINDSTLTGLLDKYNESKNDYSTKFDYYPTPAIKNAEAARSKFQTNALNEQINARVLWLMTGISSKVDSEKAELDAMTKQIDHATKQNATHSAKEQPYYDAKTQLDKLLEQHRIFRMKIDAAKIDSSIPRNSMSRIINLAVPPEFPLSRNCPLAISFFNIGLFPTVAGLLLLKSSRQQNG